MFDLHPNCLPTSHILPWRSSFLFLWHSKPNDWKSLVYVLKKRFEQNTPAKLGLDTVDPVYEDSSGVKNLNVNIPADIPIPVLPIATHTNT